MKPGDKVRYKNYGEIRTGEITRLLGKDQLHVTRLDGPMIGSTAWIHRESVVEVVQ